MNILPVWMYVHYMLAWRLEEGIIFPGTGVTGNCEQMWVGIKPASSGKTNALKCRAIFPAPPKKNSWKECVII